MYVKNIVSVDGSFDLIQGESLFAAIQLTDSSWILTIQGTGLLNKQPPPQIINNPTIIPPPFVPSQPTPKL